MITVARDEQVSCKQGQLHERYGLSDGVFSDGSAFMLPLTDPYYNGNIEVTEKELS